MQSPRAAYRAVPGALAFPSALDDADGLDLRHLPADAGGVHHVDHPRHVLVRLRDLLVHRSPRGRAHENALRFELLRHDALPGELLRLVAAEAAAGTVAAGSESLAEGAFGAQEHVGVATHVARDQDRLAEVAEPRRELRMPRGERPRGALAVHTEATRLPP